MCGSQSCSNSKWEGKENVPTVVVVDKVKEVPELLCVEVGGDGLLIRELSL